MPKPERTELCSRVCRVLPQPGRNTSKEVSSKMRMSKCIKIFEENR